ncbi:aminotransferase class I/II-fold pyridoxal phosphate-dependent enzyme [bacterium]|jgi:aspartate aminotransferase|nr:aminotransferase class I/II-fold pyridoxal phosphate-dependent enzyme [bacterium]
MKSSLNLVSNLKPIAKSETLLVNELTARLISTGRDVIKFGFGESPFDPPKRLSETLQKFANRTEYLPVQGLAELRQKICDFHERRLGLKSNVDQIYIGPGSKILIYNFLNMFKKADVLLPNPSWVSYEPQALSVGHDVIRIKTTFEGKWKVTGKSLRQVCSNRRDKSKPCIMILNYPGNPSGTTYTCDDLKDVAEAAKEYNVIIIADEIYGFLSPKKHVSIATYYPEGTVITGGLSKVFGAGGWRLGIMHVSKYLNSQIKDSLIGLASETFSSATTPVQYAAIDAYSHNEEIDSYIEDQIKILNLVGKYVARNLRAAGIQCHDPEGGFYLYPDFSPFREKLAKKGINNSLDLTTALIEDKRTQVALLPSIVFGSDKDELAVRLAFVDFDGNKALTIVDSLGTSVSESDILTYFPQIGVGTKRLVEWVDSL